MLRRGLLWLLLLPVALLATYAFTTRVLAPTEPRPLSPGELGTAAALERYVADLSDRLAAYERRKQGQAPYSDGLVAWSEDEFRPAANDLRQRIVRAPIDSPAMIEIMVAADRLVALASDPTDSDAYQRARAALDEAHATVASLRRER